jgi:hypothetical protein
MGHAVPLYMKVKVDLGRRPWTVSFKAKIFIRSDPQRAAGAHADRGVVARHRRISRPRRQEQTPVVKSEIACSLSTIRTCLSSSIRHIAETRQGSQDPAKIEAGSHAPSHSHHNERIIMMTSGRMDFRLQNETKVFPGDMILISTASSTMVGITRIANSSNFSCRPASTSA